MKGEEGKKRAERDERAGDGEEEKGCERVGKERREMEGRKGGKRDGGDMGVRLLQ